MDKELLVKDNLIIPEKTSISTTETPKTVTASTQHTMPQATFQTFKATIEEVSNKYNTYSQNKEHAHIFMDHCYVRPWNWRPESSFLKPTKTLFIPKPPVNKRKSSNPLAPLQDYSDIIDVEIDVEESPPIYDTARAKSLMEECERYAACARVDQENEDWEDKISRVNWTAAQSRLFNGIVNILNSDHMARLAAFNIHNEPICRRTIIDKSVNRMRRLMATISWDQKLTQWLHQLLLDNLSSQYLAAYLDILQTLKYKLPTFVDKMMYGPNSSNRIGVLSNESLFPLLKRPWDPVASSLMQDKPKKLPGNPIIVVVPTAPTIYSSQFKRIHKWTTLLSNLATVIVIPANIGTASQRMTMMNCIDQMLAATRGKIQEIRNEYPGRPIILIGFNAGAALALQVAQSESVLCVICLGFSLLTAEGKRGDPDDNLLELQCPVLFVIGQCSHTSLQEDMEDLRERMRVETGLIVVGSADDYLRVNKKKKRAEGITQSVVDRCIVDEVGEFVSGILLSPYPPQIRQSPAHVSPDISCAKRMKTEHRKRHNSNGSSLDSEPPSPTPRISRPGQNNTSPNLGRPPGSKSKTKLETKWASHFAQGIPTSPSTPSNSPPPSFTSITHDTSSTDSSNTDKNPIQLVPSNDGTKKIIKCTPIVSAEKSAKSVSPIKSSPIKSSPNAASKLRAMNMANRSVITSGSTLSNLLQGNYKTVPTMQPNKTVSSIKILENVTLNTNSNSKLVSFSGRTLDLSKITVLNSVNPPKPGTTTGNVLLMPDGKIKTINPTIKNAGIKYITSKKQLLANKPPKPIRKMPYIPTTTIPTNLPPPTNLTSQDIMDLPIIFADDNHMITENNTTTSQDTTTTNTAPQVVQNPIPKLLTSTTSTGKLVFINKQISLQNTTGTSTINATTLKRPITATVPLKSGVKYTKIILSKCPNDDGKPGSQSIISKITSLSPEISLKRVEQPHQQSTSLLEPIDLENELVATAVPKPNFGKLDLKNITLITKKPINETSTKLIDIPKKIEISADTSTTKKDNSETPVSSV